MLQPTIVGVYMAEKFEFQMHIFVGLIRVVEFKSEVGLLEGDHRIAIVL